MISIVQKMRHEIENHHAEAKSELARTVNVGLPSLNRRTALVEKLRAFEAQIQILLALENQIRQD